LEEYQTVGGKIKLIKLPKIILVEFKTRKVLCSAVISEYENEVIANDKLTEKLGIIFEKVGQGLWRFEEEKEINKSEEPEFWE